MGKRGNKKLLFRFVPTRFAIKNSKKITKKLKNTIVASFQAKIGWKSMRKIEIKIFVSFRYYPTRNTKFQKSQHIKKIPILQHLWRK